MSFAELLKKAADERNSIVCMGTDPIIEKIPLEEKNVEKKIFSFYSRILDACKAENCTPAAIKPNHAFFAQYGFEGLRALKSICGLAKKEKITLVFDGKRGDIGKTSEAYARECFEFWEADCATINPFMGTDSVMPFIKWCNEKGKGVYVLNRTSNEGAKDFQDKKLDGRELFRHVSEKILEWGKQAKGNAGAVVGATSLKELGEIARFFVESGQLVPLLIPGVGVQGASAAEVVQALKKPGYDLGIVRINASSSINYAYEKENTGDFAGSAAREIKRLNKEIGKLNY